MGRRGASLQIRGGVKRPHLAVYRAILCVHRSADLSPLALVGGGRDIHEKGWGGGAGTRLRGKIGYSVAYTSRRRGVEGTVRMIAMFVM